MTSRWIITLAVCMAGNAWAGEPKVTKPNQAVDNRVQLQRRTDPKKGTIRPALEVQRYFIEVQLLDFADGQALVKALDALPQTLPSALLIDHKQLSEVQFKWRRGTHVRLEITRDALGDRRVTQILEPEAPLSR